MYLHKEGKVAEYKMAGTVSGFEIWDMQAQISGFPEELSIGPGWYGDNWFESLNEARQAAMDYHETEGCALYLELHPAPEKGDYLFIAQDSDGEWCGFYEKPFTRGQTWDDSVGSYNFIQSSLPNPFWRKTLR